MKAIIFLFGLALIVAIIIPTNGGPTAVAEANPEATAEADPEAIGKAVAIALAEASEYKEKMKEAMKLLISTTLDYLKHKMTDHGPLKTRSQR